MLAATAPSLKRCSRWRRNTLIERGYFATSVQDITDAAEASVGTLYYHYGSKAQIYQVVFTEYLRQQETRTREAMTILRQAGVTSGRQLFLAGARAFLRGAWENNGLVRSFADGEPPPGFAALTRKLNQEWMRHNADVLQIGDSVAAHTLVIAATGAMGTLSRELADCGSEEAASEFIERAVEVLAAMFNVDGEARV